MSSLTSFIAVSSSDSNIHSRLNNLLIKHSFNTINLHSIEALTDTISNYPIDIIVIDDSLLDKQGIDAYFLIRNTCNNTIVILLDSNNRSIDEDKLLNFRANAIISKQQSDAIILANIKGMLQYNSGRSSKSKIILTAKDLIINLQKHHVTQDNKELKLTLGEMKLLIILANKKGLLVSRDTLFSELMHISYSGESRALDWRVSSLRRKLDDNKPPYKYIKTIRGLGYMLLT